MVPFLTAGAYAAMGTVDDQTGKLVSVFLDVLMCRWSIWGCDGNCGGCRSVLERHPGHAAGDVPIRGVGCADLPLAMFYAGSIFYVARWIDRQQWPDLILAILFSVFVAFTKNEGRYWR